jgi:hypothetical protein
VLEVTAARIRRRLGDEDEDEAATQIGGGADDLISFSGE